jgi:hypothetical protein
MPHHFHSLIWRGTPFQFERLQDSAAVGGGSAEWAVSRAGEFIGTMLCPAGATTKEFEVRCLFWLGELFQPTSVTASAGSTPEPTSESLGGRVGRP